MLRAALLAGVTLSLAAPLAAREPLLNMPVDCTLGETCFIQQYTDADPGPGAADYTCGPLSYDGHKGTDFAVGSLAAVEAGVDVYPAAPGTVTAVRDGMDDVLQGAENSPDVSERECGNGVVVDHGDGWETQYCHLKRGSVQVQRGMKVSNATVIGQVGYSGLAEFPHLHLSVRRDGEVVDPFNPAGDTSCGAEPPRTLWQDPLPYRPGGLIDAGFFAGIPEYDAVRAGTAKAIDLTTEAPALVLWGYAFGGRTGDEIALEILGPEGPLLSETVTLDKGQAQFFRAVGRRAPRGGWAPGSYAGTIRFLRDGREIDSLATEIDVKG